MKKNIIRVWRDDSVVENWLLFQSIWIQFQESLWKIPTFHNSTCRGPNVLCRHCTYDMWCRDIDAGKKKNHEPINIKINLFFGNWCGHFPKCLNQIYYTIELFQLLQMLKGLYISLQIYLFSHSHHHSIHNSKEMEVS